MKGTALKRLLRTKKRKLNAVVIKIDKEEYDALRSKLDKTDKEESQSG